MRPEAGQRHQDAVYRSEFPELERLTEITAPTLVIHGDGDRKLPLGGASGAQWEIHFQGDAVALFSWLGGALKLNFGPLVAWLEAEAKALAAKATAASAAAK